MHLIDSECAPPLASAPSRLVALPPRRGRSFLTYHSFFDRVSCAFGLYFVTSLAFLIFEQQHLQYWLTLDTARALPIYGKRPPHGRCFPQIEKLALLTPILYTPSFGITFSVSVGPSSLANSIHYPRWLALEDSARLTICGERRPCRRCFPKMRYLVPLSIESSPISTFQAFPSFGLPIHRLLQALLPFGDLATLPFLSFRLLFRALGHYYLAWRAPSLAPRVKPNVRVPSFRPKAYLLFFRSPRDSLAWRVSCGHL